MKAELNCMLVLGRKLWVKAKARDISRIEALKAAASINMRPNIILCSRVSKKFVLI